MTAIKKYKVGIFTDIYDKKQRGGISWYTGRLIKALKMFLKQDKNIELALIHARKNNDDLYFGIEEIIYPSIRVKDEYRWPKTKKCEEIFIRHNIRLIHFPSFRLIHYPFFKLRNIKFVLTIHDLGRQVYSSKKPIFSKNLHSTLRRWYHRVEDKKLDSVKNKVDRFIAISRNTKRDITQILDIPKEKISVIYEGADKIFHPKNSSEEIPTYLNKFSPYILTPALSSLIIEVYYKLLQKGIQHRLVVFNKPAFENILEEKGIKEKITFLGYVPTSQLADLYRWTELLLYHNTYEGFGLVPLEAMASSCPVISSRNGSLPEIIGKGGILLNDDEIDKWVEMAYNILTLNSKLKELTKAGLSQAQRFSWERAAKETLKVYKEVLSI